MDNNEDTLFRPAPPSLHPISATSLPNAHAPQRAVLLNQGEQVIDHGGVTARMVRGTSAAQEQVVDAWDSTDRILMGVDMVARIAFFSDDFSMTVHAYDLSLGTWIVDPGAADGFPRFVWDELGGDSIQDLDTGRLHTLTLALDVFPSSRLTA